MTRFGYGITTYLTVLWIGVTAFLHPSPCLLWNTSASVPIGLYLLQPGRSLTVGDLVAAMPPPPLAAFMNARHYLPKGVPLLKHVGAMQGQTVCRHGATITVNGEIVAVALARDRDNRALPVWTGCHTLSSEQVFLLNPGVPASFDGRYFEVLPITAITARAVLLWRFEVSK